MASIETGIQFHLPTYAHVSLPELINLGKVAKAAGVKQLWVTDNLRSRNAFVVLAGFAANIPINLGTAVTVQYFRNPVDVADSVAAISEIMDGDELSIGIARGNGNTPNFVKTPKPRTMAREMAQSLALLLAGEAVCFGDYPALADYFNFNPTASFNLNFAPKTPIRLYCGGNGPLGLAVGGEFMDGLIVGGEFKAISGAGHLPAVLSKFEEGAAKAGKSSSYPKIAEIKLSVSRDKEAARAFARPTAGRRLLNLSRRGYGPEDILALGVAPEDVARLDEAERQEATEERFTGLVTDAMLDAVFVAGEPEHCRDRMIELRDTAEQYGFKQLMYSELGPNVEESLRLLCDEIVPAL
jgi:alkanesulfonate monooxygenase SsuD/methylene tetrahydromethanopterin reductase-like flavin-dependent oxidoreductase (luciferase family)